LHVSFPSLWQALSQWEEVADSIKGKGIGTSAMQQSLLAVSNSQ
jgi:hypothetical protein